MTPLWTHANPVSVHAQPGLVGRLNDYLPNEGKVLLVTTAGFTRRGMTGRILEQLGAQRTLVYDSVTPNPEVDDLDAATEKFRHADICAIVGLGGGSVLDAAKVLSVTLPSALPRPLHAAFRDKQEQQWKRETPVVAVPTTSGTGAEVTPFATVWDKETQKKNSVAGNALYPTFALLDPEITVTLPETDTLFTSLDAVSHALESLWNKNRTPVSEAYATAALRLALDAMPGVLAKPDDLEARANMQNASLLAGLAISQTRTAVAHSISYPLTIHYGVPHGLACGYSLSKIITHYTQARPDASFRALMIDIQRMLNTLPITRHLRSYVNEEQIKALLPETHTPGRADNFDGQINTADLLTVQDAL